VQLSDDANGFTIADAVRVVLVNHAPTTAGISAVSVYEGAPPTAVNLWSAFDDLDNSDAELSFQVVANTNPGLFSGVAIDPTTGLLTLDYAPRAFGMGDITVRATDPGGVWVETSFTVTVNLEPGLFYRFYSGAWSQLPDFSSLSPQAIGTVANSDLGLWPQQTDFGVQFGGKLEVPQDGTYTFYANSDDGSRLWIDGQLVVDNDGLHAAQERSGSVDLSLGMHAIAVTHFQAGGDQSLDVSWEGPRLQKQAIPGGALFWDGHPAELQLAAPSTVMAGTRAGLTAQAFDLLGNGVRGVSFYMDANGNGVLDAADELLAADTVSISGLVSAHALTFSTGGYVLQAGDYPAGDRLLLYSAGTTIDVQDQATPTTISAVITGESPADGLVKTGLGTLVLSGDNSQSGTAVDEGESTSGSTSGERTTFPAASCSTAARSATTTVTTT